MGENRTVALFTTNKWLSQALSKVESYEKEGGLRGKQRGSFPLLFPTKRKLAAYIFDCANFVGLKRYFAIRSHI